MGNDQMLRVSKVEEWLHRAPTRPDMTTHSNCVVVRSGENPTGADGMSLAPAISGRGAGSRAPRLRLIMIPPGTRGLPHYHGEHGLAIYTVSGETEVWHGDGLRQRTVVRAGDFMYIPPGTPHLTVNRGDIMSVSVAAGTDPRQPERMVVMELPRHLADLLSLPVAIQE
jgi:uncharacterized RmlC-like cupin family protein